ncbi:DNA-binding NarL/FixJ family response regulator [Cellulosimicrobium cellulans]|uniref:response regulator transcription factor n=1 Tax=Cellulosimicrobium cellulans TaxID=1710 RepID=UPI0027DDA913|nr:response regulator transcription factor [Cellulosimicrobium cellulans]MBM7821453.1 DNA-binding NarL/FixJ family response regulator [Cellulosimicrobium cellulans]
MSDQGGRAAGARGNGQHDDGGDARGVPRTRLVIVDDDALVRAGLRLMLDGAHGIEVVGEAADGAEVTAVLDAHPTDVVLMDLRMPRVDGIEATRRVRARAGAPAVVVLTTFDSDEEVVGALHAGASGYLLKDMPPERIVAAVRAAAAGEPVLSPEIARRLMSSVADAGGERDRARAALDALTGRERDVAVELGRGAANAEIAAALFLSVPTVKAHVSNVLLKLGLENRTQVALLVHAAGLD